MEVSREGERRKWNGADAWADLRWWKSWNSGEGRKGRWYPQWDMLVLTRARQYHMVVVDRWEPRITGPATTGSMFESYRTEGRKHRTVIYSRWKVWRVTLMHLRYTRCSWLIWLGEEEPESEQTPAGSPYSHTWQRDGQKMKGKRGGGVAHHMLQRMSVDGDDSNGRRPLVVLLVKVLVEAGMVEQPEREHEDEINKCRDASSSMRLKFDANVFILTKLTEPLSTRWCLSFSVVKMKWLGPYLRTQPLIGQEAQTRPHANNNNNKKTTTVGKKKTTHTHSIIQYWIYHHGFTLQILQKDIGDNRENCDICNKIVTYHIF